MSTELIKFLEPVSIETAVSKAFSLENALGWGVQSMTRDTVSAMVLLASSRSEHYRYAIAVSPDIAQYLADLPDGSTTSREHIIQSVQVGTLIGQFDMMDLHVIQEDTDESYMVLLILDDDRLVDSFIVSRLRRAEDHVVKSILPPRKDLQ
ncbi:hypothetical protein D3C85_15580 [compost metagenome]